MNKSDGFFEYIEAELKVIREDVGKEACLDPEVLNKRAIEWVEKNAALFRAQWNKRHARKDRRYAVE